jgi:hypothetical protein
MLKRSLSKLLTGTGLCALLLGPLRASAANASPAVWFTQHLLRIPRCSTLTALDNCADWVTGKMRTTGFSTTPTVERPNFIKASNGNVGAAVVCSPGYSLDTVFVTVFTDSIDSTAALNWNNTLSSHIFVASQCL